MADVELCLERGRGMEAGVFVRSLGRTPVLSCVYVVKDYCRPPLRMYTIGYTVQNEVMLFFDGVGVEKDVCVPAPFHGSAKRVVRVKDGRMNDLRYGALINMTE